MIIELFKDFITVLIVITFLWVIGILPITVIITVINLLLLLLLTLLQISGDKPNLEEWETPNKYLYIANDTKDFP